MRKTMILLIYLNDTLLTTNYSRIKSGFDFCIFRVDMHLLVINTLYNFLEIKKELILSLVISSKQSNSENCKEVSLAPHDAFEYSD